MRQISNSKQSRVYGFSLIEVIIGLAVILAGFILFAAVLSTLPLTRNARNENVAYHIAARKIEELRNIEFLSLPGSGSFSDSGLSELSSSTASLTITDYQGESEIKHASVTITWEDNRGPRNLSVDTLIYENGISQK